MNPNLGILLFIFVSLEGGCDFHVNMPIFGHTPIIRPGYSVTITLADSLFFDADVYQISVTFYSETMSLVHIKADNLWAYHISLSRNGMTNVRVKP